MYLIKENRCSTITRGEAPLEVHVVNIPVTEFNLDWGLRKTYKIISINSCEKINVKQNILRKKQNLIKI